MNLVKTNSLQHTLVLNNQLTSSSTDGVRTLVRYCALYTPTALQEKQQHAIYQSLLFACQIGFLSCGSQMISWTGEGALRASKLFCSFNITVWQLSLDPRTYSKARLSDLFVLGAQGVLFPLHTFAELRDESPQAVAFMFSSLTLTELWERRDNTEFPYRE